MKIKNILYIHTLFYAELIKLTFLLHRLLVLDTLCSVYNINKKYLIQLLIQHASNFLIQSTKEFPDTVYRTLGSYTKNSTGRSDLIQIIWAMHEKIIGLIQCLCKVLSAFQLCYLYICRKETTKSKFKEVQNQLLIFKDIMTHLSTRNPEIKNTVL